MLGKEALSVLMFCMPITVGGHFHIVRRQWTLNILVFCLISILASTQKSVLNMASNHSHIDKPQHGCPKRAEMPDVNINTGAQSINTERAY